MHSQQRIDNGWDDPRENEIEEDRVTVNIPSKNNGEDEHRKKNLAPRHLEPQEDRFIHPLDWIL